MKEDIKLYIKSQDENGRNICEQLQIEISSTLPDAENKIWHAHPVWFLKGNPIVGYSKVKSGVRLMFWSGIDFNEKDLQSGSGKFKDASITYQSDNQIDPVKLKRWLEKSRIIQWDYKNIVKNKGKLNKLY
jgi:uncharacterized protein YdhG (YjbR/CyaY superfamily)